MDVTVDKLSKEDFCELSKSAHLACFGEDRDPEFDRYDFALFCHGGDKAISYSTILEFDAKSAYMQHGGSFTENGLITVKSYMLMMKWLKSNYAVITTRIFNYNVSMLNMAMRAGFRIIGCEYHKPNGDVLLNLRIDNE